MSNDKIKLNTVKLISQILSDLNLSRMIHERMFYSGADFI